jgi:peptidoglycan LD-endopeptidase CwlK
MVAPSLRINPALRPAVDPNLVPVEFNATSKARLAAIDPTLAQLMTAVEAQHPDAFEIGEGMRDIDTQRKYVAEGKSQTMNSKHLTGNAVDIVMGADSGKPNWNFEDYRPIADTAKATAAAMGIPDFVWGGDWKSLRDGVHFQIGGKGGSGAIPAGAGEVPLSFGADVAPVQDPTAMGLAEMFGAGGLDMGVGSLLPKRPGAEQMLLAQAKQEADMNRKIALADLMRF